MPKNTRRGDLPLDEEYSLGNPALEQTDVLPPTTTVGGKYKLGRLLGEGGMGAVYEAEHTGLGIKVAVKLLNEMFISDPSAVSRFQREARAAAAIRHPSIVEVTDTGEDESGVPFIVMELLEGESLSALLRRERLLSPGISSLIVSQILTGLAAAHEKGVIHRDLKPGNILLARLADGTYQVKILDFGISKFFAGSPHDVTAAGAVIGTPRFMAPEQARGQNDLDSRVDIYAVGVLFYRMVTGKLPFAAPTQEEVIRLILEGKPAQPRELRPELPPELERVILKAMAPDRDQRYPDARTFLADLQMALPEVIGGGTIQITAHTGVTAGPTPFSLSGPLTGSLATASRLTGTASMGGASTRPASPHALREGRGRRLRFLLPLVALVLVGGGVGGYFLWRGSGTGTTTTRPKYSGPAVRFGITRFLPEVQLVAEHSNLVRYLEDRLQRPVDLRVHEDYIDLAAQLASGKLDLAALTPSSYVRAKRTWPTLRLLATHTTSGGSSYGGIIISKAGAGIETLEDLKGKVFCYVSPTSTSGFIYPRAVLRKHGIDPDKAFRATRLTGDHLAALKALESGACDGAAVFAGIFYEAKQHGLSQERFNVLANTARIPNDAYCAPPDISAKLALELREALLSLKEGSELARRTLAPGGKSRITGFAPIADSDYDEVRRIERYADAPAPTPRKR